MTKKIVWRLKELPTADTLADLIEKEIITKDEAREILFSQEEVEERDEKSLKEEIKFLRALVEKLSNNNRTTIIETIREVERPWRQKPWMYPYVTWCNTGGGGGGDTSNAVYSYTTGASGTVTATANFSQLPI
jgi:hypothetical protein